MNIKQLNEELDKILQEHWTDIASTQNNVLIPLESKINEIFPNAEINLYTDTYYGNTFAKLRIPYKDIGLSTEQLEELDEKFNTNVEYFKPFNDDRFCDGQGFAYFNDNAERIEIGNFNVEIPSMSFNKTVLQVVNNLKDCIQKL